MEETITKNQNQKADKQDSKYKPEKSDKVNSKQNLELIR